jgi:hypothetical protein
MLTENWQPLQILRFFKKIITLLKSSGVHRNFVWGVSTNSVEDRGQTEQGSESGSPLVWGSAQFSNE